MSLIILGRRSATVLRAGLAALIGACFLAACSNAPEIPPAEQPLSKATLTLLGKKGMSAESPIFIRIFKEESELEVWKARDDGRFYHFKTYPICNWSGELGPKQKQGDKQAPEGFYTVSAGQLNPNSQFYLAFNIGYPNAYDRVHGRTGDALMVHGKCKSAGCYAMTDALIEEIYALAREAIKGGQQSFEVHAFPFRMTNAKLAQMKGHDWYPFWLTMKEGYDHFENHRLPPLVAVCERRYVVNVILPVSGRPAPDGHCPRFERPKMEPFVPRPSEQQIAAERITVPGPKLRALANAEPTASGHAAGLTQNLGRLLGGGSATAQTRPSALGFTQ
jgi:murein L,D-transpeptidase YafK